MWQSVSWPEDLVRTCSVALAALKLLLYFWQDQQGLNLPKVQQQLKRSQGN